MSAFGPKQTSALALHMSAFGGKADMTVCGRPLSRSLTGAKRTSVFAAHMSAYDPKQTCRCALHMSAYDPKRTHSLSETTAPGIAGRVRCAIARLARGLALSHCNRPKRTCSPAGHRA